MSDLRTTDTNSANDSRGRALGFEGNDFIYVLVAFVVSLGLYLVCFFILKMGLLGAAIFSGPVLLVTLGWLVFFRRGKPAGYAEDYFDDLINREGWSVPPFASPKKPYVRKSS